MQYIETEYKGPSNTRGSRIIARSSYGRSKVTISYDPALSTEENHKAAAMALATKLQWHGQWIGGGGERGNVYVRIMPHSQFNDSFTVMEAA
jgi:hypothetical protein